jgi:hypothetical protein
MSHVLHRVRISARETSFHFTVLTYSKSDIALNNNNPRTNPATLLSIFVSSTPNTKTKMAPSDHAKNNTSTPPPNVPSQVFCAAAAALATLP